MLRSTSRWLIAAFTIVFTIAGVWADASGNSSVGQPIGPDQPAAMMSRVPARIGSPPQPVFDPRDYGARADGITYDTAALQKAIDACAGTGGSVLLQGGRFLSAELTLKAGMTLYLAKDSVLLGGTRPEDYPVLMPQQTEAKDLRRSLLYADHADHLVLDGPGVIDGQGPLVRMSGKEPERPSLIRIFGSTDVTVRNITLKAPRMWTQVYSECDRLTIDHEQVIAPPGYAPNLDGMDICDCSDVTVRNCRVDSQDDSICLKSQGPRGLRGITIENNLIRNTQANAIKVGTATFGRITGIRVLNNTVYGAALGGLCIESVDGSAVSDVIVRGLDLYSVSQPIFVRLASRGQHAGSIRDVIIERVRAFVAPGRAAPSCTITGIPGARVGPLVIRDCYLGMPGGQSSIPPSPPERPRDYPQSNLLGNPPAYGIFVRHADGIVLDRIKIGCYKPDARPWLASDDAQVTTTECEDLGQIAPVAPPEFPPV